MKITLQQFGGLAPKINQALLPDNMATIAENLRIDSGSLSPLKKTLIDSSVPITAKSIYRYNNEWLYWDAEDVSVVRSQIANDLYKRIYFTGDGYPQYRYIFSDSTSLSLSSRLGVPKPTYPPILSTSSSVGAPTVDNVSSSIEFTAGAFTPLGNATITGGNNASKTTTGSNGVWNTQCYSTESYKNACAVRFSIPVRAYGAVAGLNGNPSVKSNLASIEFAISSNNKGVVKIYESGKPKGSFGTHVDDDVFEIEYRGAKIIYKKNGEVLRESKTLIERTFFFDSSLAGQGSEISGIEIGTYSSPSVSPVFKAGSVTLNGNATITGNRAEKTSGADGWNRQAYTLENYTSGCLVKFQFGTTSGAAGGLNGPPLTASGYNNIDYAIVGTTSGNIKIFESGSDLGVFGTYVFGDSFEIQYENDTVTYRKNGIEMRSVATDAGRTFYFDSSLYAKGSVIQAIEFGTILHDEVVVEAFVEEASEKERYYVYTYVTPLGEEGPPSPPTLIKVNDLQDVTIAFQSEDLTGYNLGPVSAAGATPGARRRVYRTAQGTTATVYLYVGEAPIDSLSMADNVLDVSLGEILPSTTWFPPPEDLAQLTAHPNGFMIGFSGNALCPSEIGFPHAFDPLNQIAFPAPISGIAVTGDSIIVMTEEAPFLVTGASPDQLSAVQIDHPQTCVSRGSIVNMGGYVMMASPDGLLSVTANDMAVATQAFFTRDQWQALNPESLKGFFYEGIYLGFSTNRSFMFDMRTENAILTDIVGESFIAGYRDKQSDSLYLLASEGGFIKRWESV